MKFAEHLSAHITPEWRKQYIQYETMKEMIYEAIEEAPSSEMTDTETIARYYARFAEMFFQFCDKELQKINTFFSEKLAEATRKMGNLKADLHAAEEVQQHHGHAHTVSTHNNLRRRKSMMAQIPVMRERSKEKQTNIKKMHDIKLAFSEFYLSLILLQNYQTLNFTGFRKILKKHDKLLETESGARWRQDNVETSQFYTSKHVDHLIKDTESVFTTQLEGGDRQKAMKRLRVPPLGEQLNPWTNFRVGLFCGVFLVLVIVAIIAAVFTSSHHTTDWEPALRMYRGCFLIFLIIFLLGINTYGWRSSGVNHVLIFELDPRDNLTHQQLLELSGFFSVIWGLSVIAYLFSDYIYVPVFANPLCLVIFLLLYFINPVHILHFRARRWLQTVLLRILTAPFHHVGFADFWLADQLNSLVMVLSDFEFLLCFYIKNIDWRKMEMTTGEPFDCGSVAYAVPALVSCLPAWFRFAQCLRRYRDTRLVFPHIVNAGKYSTTFFVVVFSSLNAHYIKIQEKDVTQNNPFFYLWICAAIISTCYTFIWDIKMDWGLFDRNAGENRFLREEIVYAYKGYYYFAIIEDFILRFVWTLTVSVGEGGLLHKEILKSVLGPLEVFRRFIWNFFRLENEHLNNCGQFRAVRDISIVPIDANDQALLEKMMDDEDGVEHRSKGGRKRGQRDSVFDQTSVKTTVLPDFSQRTSSRHIPWGHLVDSTVSTSCLHLVDGMPYPPQAPPPRSIPNSPYISTHQLLLQDLSQSDFDFLTAKYCE